MKKFAYTMPSRATEKPKADISIITDYDQRYLGIISKIFKNGMTAGDLNDVLYAGGNIAAYWHKGRLVGAIVWTWCNEAGGQILYIGFKKRQQGKGFGKLLLDYAVYKTTAKEGYKGNLSLWAEIGDEYANAANFFEKYRLDIGEPVC
ncbi:MAG: GNAT family N-acetyltransferase [Defluviitaleaceae bacterium]|nr:GNAT family N-acetyltransferase [Defluviitaleaceae bacterium]